MIRRMVYVFVVVTASLVFTATAQQNPPAATTGETQSQSTVAKVQGRVVTGQAGVAGAEVRLVQGSDAVGTAKSSADGSFTISESVTPGTYTLEARRTGFLVTHETITVTDAGATTTLPLVKGTGTQPHVVRLGSIAGKLAAPAGQGIPGATITLAATVPGVRRARATTGPDGTFAFDNLLPGNYNLIVTGTGLASSSTPVEVRAGQKAQKTIAAKASAR